MTSKNHKNPVTNLAGVMILCLFASAVIASLFITVGIPTVGLTQDGECKWIEAAPDYKRSSCPDVMPTKYNKTIVSADYE